MAAKLSGPESFVLPCMESHVRALLIKTPA